MSQNVLEKDAKNYIVKQRKVDLPGLGYCSDNPDSNENTAFAQKVHDIFDVSGMSEFIKKISNEKAIQSMPGPSRYNK